MSGLPNDRKPNQWWLVLLLVPFVGVLCVPFFNRVDPQLWGVPFFFWYQFLWVIISALLTALVYFKATPKLPLRRGSWERQRE
jgi:hypothetical protein